MSKRPLSSVTRRFFLKASSVGGAIGAVAATGVGAFLEACSGGSLVGGNCNESGSPLGYGGSSGYGSAYGSRSAYGGGYGCAPSSSQSPYGGGNGGYGYGGTAPGYGYGGSGYGYGGGYGYGTGGYGYGGYGYGTGGYGYGYGAHGYGYGYGYGASLDPARSDEPDTALRLGLAPGRVGPAQRIRV